MEKETLITTYKAISKSVLSYCAPIWAPTVADANWKDLQAAQNSGLKTALGCHKMADTGHVHAEAKMLPVKEHCAMLSKQFLLSTKQTGHPSQHDDISTPPRIMRKSLSIMYHNEISHLIRDGGNSKPQHKLGLNSIHSNSVQAYLETAPPNKVLNAPPPEIHAEERSLPRKTRSTLSQLRSGKSTYLKSFMNRIDPNTPPNCPDCGHDNHSTNHLFECPSKRTDLKCEDLWNRPRETALFLGLETGEQALDEGDNREEDPG